MSSKIENCHLTKTEEEEKDKRERKGRKGHPKLEGYGEEGEGEEGNATSNRLIS